ncbi:hypothetical protein A0J61_10292 [Choanephora cucurbitarum]|uniref:Uncharacterized protein n=1 Tax=Choanephora cucurbitarum TaxID=101091 RepID=A0A1C7MZ20_9FUNG|nr:hypothetical protein A0J61_10292 [Choanephora cucurbitarum]
MCLIAFFWSIFYTGSKGIKIRGGNTGSVRVRLKWDPQLLLRRKTQKTFMGTTRLVTTAFNFAQPPKNTSTSTSLRLDILPQNDTMSNSISSRSAGNMPAFSEREEAE